MPRESPAPARRTVCMAICASLLPISACESKPMYGTFEVVLFSYLDRPIFDVLLSGFDIGVAGAWAGNMNGGGSMSGVSVKFGAHEVSWRLGGPEGMVRNGETVHAKNKPVLDKPPTDHGFLCVHVYPDDTVELVTSQHFPTKTPRGIQMGDALRKRHGQ